MRTGGRTIVTKDGKAQQVAADPKAKDNSAAHGYGAALAPHLKKMTGDKPAQIQAPADPKKTGDKS